jgi:two-component system, cell cycle sensor histidine kinase and response regulator CckA
MTLDGIVLMLTAGSPDLLRIVSADGQIVFVSASTTRCLGFVPARWGEEAHPSDVRRVEEWLYGDGEELLTSRARNAAGGWCLLESARGRVELSVGPSPAFVVVSRVRPEHGIHPELAEGRSLLSVVVDETSDAIYVKDLQGQYVMINAAGARLFGRAAEEILGKRDADLVPPEVAQSLDGRDREVTASTLPQTFIETHGTGAAARTFMTRKCLWRANDGTVLGVIGISSEMTELRRLQEELRHAQKMHTIGQLAAGVAHDFKNLLMVINGNAELLREDLAVDDPKRVLLDEVLDAGQGGAALSRQLLAFSRKQPLEPQVVEVDHVLERLMLLVRRIVGQRIDVTFRPNARNGCVKVDADQLQQAIINLAVNARDAMSDDGRFRIDTANVDVLAGGSATPIGQYVRISVHDTGRGIDEATRMRIFEPFFTTKEIGAGTGLGLAMVHGFVKQSGGHIELASEVGRGTTFVLYLPRIEDP